MQNNFSVFREGKAMADGLEELKVIRERLKNAHLSDKSTEFNTQRDEVFRLENLMETAFATAVAANFRTEESWSACSFLTSQIVEMLMSNGYVTHCTIRIRKYD